MKRVMMCLAVAAVFGFSGLVHAAEATPKAAEAKPKAAKKVVSAKKTKSAPKVAAAVEPSPAEVQEKAIASCQKHVESMLRESAETRFSGGGDTKIQPTLGEEFDIAGWVTSRSNAGVQRRAGYNCRAKRYGTLWTTKTSLAWDQ